MEYFTSGKVCNPEKNLIVAYCKIQLENKNPRWTKSSNIYYIIIFKFHDVYKNNSRKSSNCFRFQFYRFLKKLNSNKNIKKVLLKKFLKLMTKIDLKFQIKSKI